MLNLWQKIFGTLIHFSVFLYAVLVLVPKVELYGTVTQNALLLISVGFVFFIGFFVGVLLADRTSEDKSVLLVSGLLYTPILGLELFLDITLFSAFSLFGLLFIFTVWNGYRGAQSNKRGNQPYQKYDWIPAETYKLPLVPYYMFKYYQTHKTLSAESESDRS